MQSLTEILFTSWIGIFVLLGSAFMFSIGFFFRYWIKKNIAIEEAEMARADKAADKTPPTA